MFLYCVYPLGKSPIALRVQGSASMNTNDLVLNEESTKKLLLQTFWEKEVIWISCCFQLSPFYKPYNSHKSSLVFDITVLYFPFIWIQKYRWSTQRSSSLATILQRIVPCNFIFKSTFSLIQLFVLPETTTMIKTDMFGKIGCRWLLTLGTKKNWFNLQERNKKRTVEVLVKHGFSYLFHVM